VQLRRPKLIAAAFDAAHMVEQAKAESNRSNLAFSKMSPKSSPLLADPPQN